MESINQDKTSEYNLANKLYYLKYLRSLEKCTCNSTYFKIKEDNYNRISGICFGFNNNKCKKKYSIRINSFFSKFVFIRIEYILELIKCLIF